MSETIALFVGPSGSGKTTVADKLSADFGLNQIYSYTTRPPRSENEGGHLFVSDEAFDELTGYVAYTEFDGNRYAATEEQVELNDIYVIDIDGAQYFKAHYFGDKIPVVFYFDVPPVVLQQRMLQRGDDKRSVFQRLSHDKDKFQNALARLKVLYDDVHVVQNADLDECAKEIMKTLQEVQRRNL